MADTRTSGGASTPAGEGTRRVYAVSDLLRGLRALLEDSVGRVWVAGEVSNFFAAGSGHQYFTLKDAQAQIRCAFFRADARLLPFDLEDGLEILVFAESTIYEARGELQLVVRHVEPRGAGALQLAFEQLRRSLEAEGLFDDARKRDLPAMPRRVGVVTSERGAALRDVLEVSGRRFPAAPILLSPSRVQGEGAGPDLARALERVARAPEVDVVLLVRGGGSLEDLWAFNTEIVVRAVAACPVPVVCGVGHEVDLSLADLAADVRAPTPSAAAMLALPDRGALAARLAAMRERLVDSAVDHLDARRHRLRAISDALRLRAPSRQLAEQRERLRAARLGLRRAERAAALARRTRAARGRERLGRARPRIDLRRQRLRGARRALARVGAALATQPRGRLAALAARLDSLSPLAVLARGYAVARRADDERVVREASDVQPGVALQVRVARARIRATVDEVDPILDDDAVTGRKPS